MIGNFKNGGAKWDRSPVLVNDHDFRSQASGVGISYGIYDPPHNRGSVCVGVSHDTPAFAAHSIATGGNARVRIAGAVFPSCWSWRTQAAATVAPPGPGKPKSRHTCAMHSASPLRSLTTLPARPNGIPSSIVCSPRSPKTGLPSHWTAMKKCSTSFATSTKTGLVVTAYLDRKEYPTGLKPDRSLISALHLKHSDTLPQWNYTIAPNL